MKTKKGFSAFFASIGESFSEIGGAMRHGDWRTRLSFIIMGFGCFSRGQIIKGLIYLAAFVLFVLYMALFAWPYLLKLNTLGTELVTQVWDERNQMYINQPGDNSTIILLYNVLTIFLFIFLVCLYFSNIKAAYRAQELQCAGKKPNGIKTDLKNLLDKNLHISMLTPPAFGVLAFTVIPIVFMMLMAFTNFDRNHQPPGNLFTWVGLENFRNVFGQNPLISTSFFSILGWTLIWAVFATFLNYFLGMVVALMINKKGIKLKGLWRFCFVLAIAVPAFVTLMFMRRMLQDQGAVNTLLQDVLGWTKTFIPFLTDGMAARITVIAVNLWIGIPYTILITTGILMNIPEDLFESARIDGAGPFKQFTRITLPYMLSVTTPYLITQFVGNINNFNAIYFLTAGAPLSLDYYNAGKTDLLVTWLYKLTVNFQDYNLAAVIGILVFVVCAVFSLLTFNLTASAKKEETFS